MFHLLKNFFSKEIWGLVKTIELDVLVDKKKVTFYFMLFESNKGNRNTKFGCTKDVPDLQFLANQLQIYHSKVLRWEAGRYDPDIPRYSEISEEDVANALRGKI